MGVRDFEIYYIILKPQISDIPVGGWVSQCFILQHFFNPSSWYPERGGILIPWNTEIKLHQ